jgi:hypothetical protein
MSAFKQLGPVLLPQAEASVDTQPRKQTNLSETGFLSSGSVDVERVTNSAPTLTLSGRFRPPLVPRDRVPLLADEFDSLIAGDIGPLGLFDQDGANGRLAGYYEVEEGSSEPTHPERPTIQDWSLTLRRVGNRSNLFRAVTTTETAIDNPFSVSSPPTPGVLIPSLSDARWFNSATGTTERATANSGVETPDGTAAKYLPSGASFDDPVLLYDVPLDVDVIATRVFNNRGFLDKFDSNGVRQWRAVYDPEFQPTGSDEGLFLTNRRLRILAGDPPNGGFGADEWDPQNNQFSTVISLTNSWVPQTIDLVDIGLHQITVDLRMSDGSTTHPARFRLPYGATRARITSAPSASGAMPSGLQSLLDPIAYEGDRILQPSRTVVPKRTIRT